MLIAALTHETRANEDEAKPEIDDIVHAVSNDNSGYKIAFGD